MPEMQVPAVIPSIRYEDARRAVEHFQRAKAAGAEVVREPRDEDYGGRGYTARDPEGNYWSIGTYRPSLD